MIMTHRTRRSNGGRTGGSSSSHSSVRACVFFDRKMDLSGAFFTNGSKTETNQRERNNQS